MQIRKKGGGTFWLKIEQFWPFEEISIFGNSGHLEWRAGLSDTILKGTHPGTYLQYYYYQYYNIHNTGNTSIANITILVIPVL
jgi:hypothetical protein